ncbi:MAG: pyridoxamine 5'-phosphate oxidase family protein [Candidatus Hodarchaeales archaeon]
MKDNEIIDFAVDLMMKSKMTYFTTVKECKPYTRALFNLKNASMFPKQAEYMNKEGKLSIYLATNTSSEKIEQVKNNPAAALYYCIPDSFLGAMVGGNVEIVEDSRIKEGLWQDDWTMYYPKGVGDEDFTVLRMNPEIIRVWISGKGKHELKL